MRIQSKPVYSILFLITILLYPALTSCKLFTPSPPSGEISFIDYKDSEKLINGYEGTIDFGSKLIQMGDRDIKALRIENTGEGDLVITDVTIDGDEFCFMDDILPDLPLVVPAGKTISDIVLEFAPQSSGDKTGVVNIKTAQAAYYLDLAGTGLWQLTLTVDAAGANSKGKITSPLEVLPGESISITSSDSKFNLACEIDMLNELVNWSVSGTPDALPVFEDESAKETTVELKSHTEISMAINNPFVRVPNDYADIQSAINNCILDGCIAVVVSAGAYNVTGLTLKADVPVYGGYKSDWSSRAYKTEAERSDSTYSTVINVTSAVTAGSAVGKNVFLEGFVINGNTTFNSGSTAVLQYNTITALGGAAGCTADNASPLIQYNTIYGGDGAVESVPLLCTNSAQPVIQFNTITGGGSAGDNSKSFGVKVTEGSSPVIFANTISGGVPGGVGSYAYGISNDFECYPLITGNTINGGDASGTSGQSFGIYMINNGSATAGYNQINGGSGTTAYALFVAYGGNLYLDYNNIYTSSSSGYAVYVGTQGRARRLIGNGLYDCPVSLLHTSLPASDITTIDGVNEYFYTDTNKASPITFTVPEDPNYE